MKRYEQWNVNNFMKISATRFFYVKNYVYIYTITNKQLIITL